MSPRLADAYRAADGQWRDLAVVASEQARAVLMERIKAGNPPTAAQGRRPGPAGPDAARTL